MLLQIHIVCLMKASTVLQYGFEVVQALCLKGVVALSFVSLADEAILHLMLVHYEFH